MQVLFGNENHSVWVDIEEHNYNPNIICEHIREMLDSNEYKTIDARYTWGVTVEYILECTLYDLCRIAEEIDYFKQVLSDWKETVQGNLDMDLLCQEIIFNFKE